jgi:hypothetical protein
MGRCLILFGNGLDITSLLLKDFLLGFQQLLVGLMQELIELLLPILCQLLLVLVSVEAYLLA